MTFNLPCVCLKMSKFYIIFCCIINNFIVQTDGPAIVRINLFVRSIATISDIKMVSVMKGHVENT